MPKKTYYAHRIFTGKKWLTNQAITINNGIITSIKSSLKYNNNTVTHE